MAPVAPLVAAGGSHDQGEQSVTRQVAVSAKDFLQLKPGPPAVPVALRAGVSVVVPLLTVLALGRPEWSAYAAFGAFTSLYGRNHVHLPRAVMQGCAAVALVAAVALGALVATLPASAWVMVPVGAVVAGVGTALSAAQDWHPPGPIFLLFGFGAVASVPHSLGDVPVAVAVAGSSALFALLVGNATSMLGRRKPRRPVAPVTPRRPTGVAAQSLAALLAGVAGTASGVGHPYWAMVAAVAPLSAPGLVPKVVRAGHRAVGTLLGLLTSAVLLPLPLGAVGSVLAVAVLQVATELLIGRNYGLALLCITPMALLMGQLAAPRPPADLLIDRGVETLVGVLVAGLVIAGEELLRRRWVRSAG
jgi:uncharacterized membrane protein YccC